MHLKAAGRSSPSIESYAGSLALLDGVLGVDIPLEALSADVLDAAVTSMSAAGSADGRQRVEATLDRFRSTYRAFFRWAFETGRIPRNPAVRLNLARVDSPPTPPITPRETRLFLSAIRRSDDPLRLRDEALFSTYALTGLRRSQALCLDVSDYDAEERTSRVKDGKGRRVRTVPVVQPLGLLLEGPWQGGGAPLAQMACCLATGKTFNRVLPERLRDDLPSRGGRWRKIEDKGDPPNRP